MARVFTQAEAARLGLPGRSALDIVSVAAGARSVTLRLAEIPPADPAAPMRRPHAHMDCEECIFVLSGSGRTEADSGEFVLNAGDTILIPPGEYHVTRNTGSTPLLLLCFYPVADILPGTIEPEPESR